MSENTSTARTGIAFLAFAAGAAAGAAAALLLAPRSGPESRARVAAAARSTKDLASRVPGAVREAGGAARQAFGEAMNG